MSDRKREAKSKKISLLSKASVILPSVAGILLAALLLYLWVSVNFEEQQNRTGGSFKIVEDYKLREVKNETAPAGVIREYTFTLREALKKDTCLAFYTVHQSVEVYIDGELVYSLKPSRKSFIRTIGSNWTMIPLYREDADKEICVDIIPIYKSFANRDVEFLIGSRLSICADRLYRDLPQLILSIIAVLVGIVFMCIAVYKRINRHSDDGLAALGLFSTMMGLWRLTDTRFSPFLVPQKPVLMFYTSVVMLMIGIVPMIRSMRTRFHKIGGYILDLYCIAVALVCIVQLLLQIFAGVDLRENLNIVHITIVIGAIIIIGNVIYDRVKFPGDKGGNVSTKATLILVVGALADIISFYMKGTSSGLLFSLTAMLIYIIFRGINMMLRYIEKEKEMVEKDRILAENERQLAESRISTMISQISPHFIYNTLGSIEQLCEIQPETAAKLVHNFSHYLRGNFSELDNPAPILLSKEIKHVQYYISIEQVRFPDIEIRFDLKADDFLIPALSVQPLVENSIKHGLMKLPRGGAVTISSYETDGYYCVSVEDTGVGFDTSILHDERKHVGLRNIRGRLESMCNGSLTVESTPGIGTKVLISIPKEVRE